MENDPSIEKYGLNEEWQRLGTLGVGKENVHPSGVKAYEWFKEYVRNDPQGYLHSRIAIYLAADHGNELAMVLRATINRLQQGAPVSDRYILGLSWFLRDLREGVVPRGAEEIKELLNYELPKD